MPPKAQIPEGSALEESIIANLVLLIESDLIDESSSLNAHIPDVTSTLRRRTGVCEPRCPVPSDWSPWTCHCPNTGDANPDGLVDCRCGANTRSRIQTCTNVAGVTCNIYHDGLKPFVNGAANFNAAASEYNNACKTYGYGQYLDNTPVYGPVGNSLKSVIEYEAGSSVDDLMKWYPGQNQDSPCTQPVPVVSKNMFKEHLEDPSKNEFSFAREDDTCATTSTEVKDSETPCDKSCGCGTYTKTSICFYKGGDKDGKEVPEDSDDFKCSCPANKGRVLYRCKQYNELIALCPIVLVGHNNPQSYTSFLEPLDIIKPNSS